MCELAVVGADWISVQQKSRRAEESAGDSHSGVQGVLWSVVSGRWSVKGTGHRASESVEILAVVITRHQTPDTRPTPHNLDVSAAHLRGPLPLR